MAKCLYCYKELNGNERDFHKACSKKIFGTLEAPILPYTHNNRAWTIYDCRLMGALYFEAANRTVRQSSRIRGSDNASCGDSQDTSCAA